MHLIWKTKQKKILILENKQKIVGERANVLSIQQISSFPSFHSSFRVLVCVFINPIASIFRTYDSFDSSWVIFWTFRDTRLDTMKLLSFRLNSITILFSILQTFSIRLWFFQIPSDSILLYYAFFNSLSFFAFQQTLHT